ncbi:hypothetical protein QUA79_36335, partial [Microcoleus sp. F8-D1]
FVRLGIIRSGDSKLVDALFGFWVVYAWVGKLASRECAPWELIFFDRLALGHHNCGRVDGTLDHRSSPASASNPYGLTFTSIARAFPACFLYTIIFSPFCQPLLLDWRSRLS